MIGMNCGSSNGSLQALLDGGYSMREQFLFVF